MAPLFAAEGDHTRLRFSSRSSQPIEITFNQAASAGAVDSRVWCLGVRVQRASIELSLRRFRYDDRGRITKLDRVYSWLEDPGSPLAHEIVRLTGLTDADVAGCRIDELLAIRLLKSASVIVSHNAAFDRPFVEERLPAVRGLPWACSCPEIDWPDYGFDGRNLGWLLAQAGWFHSGHRAEADVGALLMLLSHDLHNGCTGLARLLENARRPGWIVRAVGANFEIKDRLNERGYRWDTSARLWFRDVADESIESERRWLADFIYRPDLSPSAEGPECHETSWTTRYSRPALPKVCLWAGENEHRDTCRRILRH